ncbi:unnamed protein product [Effrenium voratum]|nr:unnamed protein product [Effrenium voratum]
MAVRRHGEAENPGPTLTIGTTNPTGLNGKALYISTLAPGIWNVSETHLAAGAIRPFDRQLKFHAQNDNRLQSLLHSLRAGGQEATHQLYRAEGSPGLIPDTTPDLDILERIFHDYQYNFRSFESWNLRQRIKCNKTRMQEHHARIFKAIKPARRDPIDRLVQKTTATIIAVSSDGTQILTDQPFKKADHTSWWVDNTPANVTQLTSDTYQIDTDLLLVVGQQLHQHIHITEDAKIQATLGHYWSERWSKHQNLPPEAWDRIYGFIKAFVPRGAIAPPPLQLQQWDQSLQRFRKHTARGSDGYGLTDLTNMSAPLRQAHVNLLTNIEHGAQWPQQLLTGFAHGIAKCPEAEEVSQFRPIIVLSMIYRNWASLRARQGLSKLSQLMDCPAFGFLPSREAQEIWLPLQALIELRAQQDQPLVGCVADVEKAFNHLPRLPIKQVAKHVGFPSDFVEAWHRFLTGFSRRFVVHDTIGTPLFSNCGYPEGCPLSCLAMVLVDWCYHLYQSHFSPRATSISFVDNLEIVSNQPGALLQAVVSQDTFLEMFQLSIDADKTYLWAVQPQHRKQLALLGRRISQKDKDLGGHMTYGARRKTAHHPDLLAGLHPIWALLKKINLPSFNKYFILFQAIWPKIFHSAPIEDLSTASIKQLSTNKLDAYGTILLYVYESGYYSLVHGVSKQMTLTFRIAATVTYGKNFISICLDLHLVNFKYCIYQVMVIRTSVKTQPMNGQLDGTTPQTQPLSMQIKGVTLTLHYFGATMSRLNVISYTDSAFCRAFILPLPNPMTGEKKPSITSKPLTTSPMTRSRCPMHIVKGRLDGSLRLAQNGQRTLQDQQ